MSTYEVGDRVLVRWRGMEGWQTVKQSDTGDLILMPLDTLFFSEMAVLDHKPAPVKVTVELPDPEPWTACGLLAELDPHYGGSVRFGVTDSNGFASLILTAERAEEYALAVLSLAYATKEAPQ